MSLVLQALKDTPYTNTQAPPNLCAPEKVAMWLPRFSTEDLNIQTSVFTFFSYSFISSTFPPSSPSFFHSIFLHPSSLGSFPFLLC